MTFPLSLWDMCGWLAVTATILLITSELISPHHAKTHLLVNKKRLRNVALTLGILFLITAAVRLYGMMLST